MDKTVRMTEALYGYLLDHSLREPDVLRLLREENDRHPHAELQIAPEQGQFLQLLTLAFGFTRAIEVGVFTGYSSLAVALAMPANGRIIACDVNEEWTATARRYWLLGGVAQKIDLRIAPALDTLDALIADGQSGRHDFVFIDADKQNYARYYERAVELVRPGGLIAIDNTLWYGHVADPATQDDDTRAIRALNRRVMQDPRVCLSLLPVADGMTLALKLD